MVTNGRAGERSEREQPVGIALEGGWQTQNLVGHCKNCDFNLRDIGSQWEVLSRRVEWSDLGLKDPCLYTKESKRWVRGGLKCCRF